MIPEDIKNMFIFYHLGLLMSYLSFSLVVYCPPTLPNLRMYISSLDQYLRSVLPACRTGGRAGSPRASGRTGPASWSSDTGAGRRPCWSPGRTSALGSCNEVRMSGDIGAGDRPDQAGEVLDGLGVGHDDPGRPLQGHPGQVGVAPVPVIIILSNPKLFIHN